MVGIFNNAIYFLFIIYLSVHYISMISSLLIFMRCILVWPLLGVCLFLCVSISPKISCWGVAGHSMKYYRAGQQRSVLALADTTCFVRVP
jgi:hypothetical protein